MKYVLLATLLVSACGGVTSPAPVQQPSTSVPVRVGGTIPAPTKIKDVVAIYPSEALQARVSGIVILEAIIGEDGKMRSVTVIRSVPLLDQAAVNAVMGPPIRVCGHQAMPKAAKGQSAAGCGWALFQTDRYP